MFLRSELSKCERQYLMNVICKMNSTNFIINQLSIFVEQTETLKTWMSLWVHTQKKMKAKRIELVSKTRETRAHAVDIDMVD